MWVGYRFRSNDFEKYNFFLLVLVLLFVATKWLVSRIYFNLNLIKIFFISYKLIITTLLPNQGILYA